ncbi:MAG: hypothetical protein KKE40_06910 [Planctomycetes bacterium]|nr:hypothetical protein [Planctomycetota bacterium]
MVSLPDMLKDKSVVVMGLGVFGGRVVFELALAWCLYIIVSSETGLKVILWLP